MMKGELKPPNRRRILVVAAAASWLSGQSLAADDQLLACRFANPPVVPSGTKADSATMATTATSVRQFVADMQHSLDCLDALTTTTDMYDAQLQLLRDNGVNQMHAIADAFNRELAIFRAREANTVHPYELQQLENVTHH
jgi:hypothetical protein